MREDFFAVEAPDPTIVQTEKVQNFLKSCGVRAQEFERKVALVSNESLRKAKTPRSRLRPHPRQTAQRHAHAHDPDTRIPYTHKLEY